MAMTFDQEGYNLTENPNALPEEFLDVTCENFFVEFLRVDTAGLSVERRNNAKNHAILKIDFEHAYEGYYSGVRIGMAVNFDIGSTGPDGDVPSLKPGKLLVKPVGYRLNSTSSARTCEIYMGYGMPLGCIIRSLVESQLHRFDFVNIDDKYFGCRNFITQALYILEQYQYISADIKRSIPDHPQTPVDNIFDYLGLRFPGSRIAASSIDRGNFDYYARVETAGMPYVGSQRAQDIEELLSG